MKEMGSSTVNSSERFEIFPIAQLDNNCTKFRIALRTIDNSRELVSREDQTRGKTDTKLR